MVGICAAFCMHLIMGFVPVEFSRAEPSEQRAVQLLIEEPELPEVVEPTPEPDGAVQPSSEPDAAAEPSPEPAPVASPAVATEPSPLGEPVPGGEEPESPGPQAEPAGEVSPSASGCQQSTTRWGRSAAGAWMLCLLTALTARRARRPVIPREWVARACDGLEGGGRLGRSQRINGTALSRRAGSG